MPWQDWVHSHGNQGILVLWGTGDVIGAQSAKRVVALVFYVFPTGSLTPLPDTDTE